MDRAEPMRRAPACLLLGAAALLLPAPGGAQAALTPEGPATVRGNFLGAHTLEGRPPEVVVRWSVTVSPGGGAGPVRLRILRPGDRGTVVGSGPLEWLPAAPGTHGFAVNPGIPYDPRDAGLALDQQVGGHAIVRVHPPRPELGRYADPAQLFALDVFRPPLADGASDVAYAERRLGEELLVKADIERDVDRDRLGDETQDRGDLRLLAAGVAERRGSLLTIVARVRNVGGTVRHMPHIVVPRLPAGSSWSCDPPGSFAWPISCPGARLEPGAEAVLRIRVRPKGGRPPKRVEVASEGVDVHPADNAVAVTSLRVRPLERRRLTFSVASSRPGRVKVVARVAGVRIVERVRFRRAGRRVVRLAPVGRRDRARLAAARRRPGRLRMVVSVVLGEARSSLRLKL